MYKVALERKTAAESRLLHSVEGLYNCASV